jgi:outer membrane immunogenic protein
MRKMLLSGFALFAAFAGAPVLAADMALKAPPPPPTPATSWNGCYFGPNVGAKWADTSGEVDVGPAPATVGPGGTAPATAAGVFPLTGVSSATVVGGGQLGCNFQRDRWVYGVEGDIDAQRWSASRVVGAVAPFPFVPGDNFSVTSNWQASIRGRLGYAWDRWLLYATGGVAFTNVRANTDFIPIGIFPATIVGDSKTLTGGTVGGGLEYAITKNVSLGFEGRYTWYGSQTFNAGLLSTSAAVLPGGTTFAFAPSSQRINLDSVEVLAKLNWHFDLGGPVATRY